MSGGGTTNNTWKEGGGGGWDWLPRRSIRHDVKGYFRGREKEKNTGCNAFDKKCQSISVTGSVSGPAETPLGLGTSQRTRINRVTSAALRLLKNFFFRILGNNVASDLKYLTFIIFVVIKFRQIDINTSFLHCISQISQNPVAKSSQSNGES